MWLFDKIADWFERKDAAVAEDDGPPDAPAPAVTVTVKRGDTLWNIAKDITGDGMKWRQLADANPDKKWNRDYVIRPGDVLVIPKEWSAS